MAEGFLNAEPAGILLLFVVVIGFLLALFDIRLNKKSNISQQINEGATHETEKIVR
jgi:hypothetical protein